MLALSLCAPFLALLVAEAPHGTAAPRCDRRGVLVRAAAACGVRAASVAGLFSVAAPPLPAHADVASQILKFDGDGKLLDDYSGETQFRTLRQGAASLQILAAWKLREDGSYEDPTLGSAATDVVMRTIVTDRPETAALGRPEQIDLVRTLELEPELVRADLVAAAVRKSDGVTFYDFDLALSPSKCDTEMATACLPNKVILLSCGVRAGQLHVVRVDASPDQWKRAGTALRLLRSSFTVDVAAA